MPPIKTFFSNFFSFFILLFHLGCFTPSSSSHNHHHHFSSSTFKKKLTHPKTTLYSFLKHLFSSPPSQQHDHIIPQPSSAPSIPSPSSSTRSLRLNPAPLITPTQTNNHIHPCSICGEIFHTQTLLHHHHSTTHAVSELTDGENIIRIIFKTGWPDRARSPTIRRVLKIHNTPKITTLFEQHRERVKTKAAAATSSDERCIADGNEVLRFCCTTFTCGLESSICGHSYCSACGIIRAGFSEKLDGISTMPTSWKAHVAVPEDLEEEFSFMRVKRAVLVCRVVAGRVGFETGVADGFDSVVGGFDRDELVVFNPRAVLPCFVIVYTV